MRGREKERTDEKEERDKKRRTNGDEDEKI